ncbi:MAG: glycosyl hydrolase family 17 protein [Myxococcota bacterium]
MTLVWTIAPLFVGACKKDQTVEAAAETSAPAARASEAPRAISGAPNIEIRPFEPRIEGKWVGNGMSYGPYRDGESPDSEEPTSKAHILEDMQILSKRWNLIRTYGFGEVARDILEVIRDNGIPMRVMQGAWLSKHQTKAQNDAQVDGAIELAKEFPDIVVAVNVGNEALVDWSGHRIEDPSIFVSYVRQVRAAIPQPVTVCDDYNYWNKAPSKQVADEVDFICLHAYAFWNDQPFDNAAAWTQEVYNGIQAMHPAHRIAFGETGWPTSRVYDDGSYEGGLVGVANEENQKGFFDWYDGWVDDNEVISFYFEAFDENWKGGWDGANPADKAEKHWGLYKSDRTPKLVLEK